MDHVALYHAMNYYHKNVEPSANRMIFNAFGLEIDQYFMAKAADETPQTPEQKLPKELRAFIDALNRSIQPHRYEVGSFLLGNDSSQRKETTKHIKTLLTTQSSKGQRTVRLMAKDMGKGLSIGQVTEKSWEKEELRCALFMKKNGLGRWLSVQIDIEDGLTIKKIVELRIEDYTEDQLSEAQDKLNRDLEQNFAKLNIARNQLCPCGSGERFKNCHGKKK